MLSNSDTEEIRDFYKDYKIFEIDAPRKISCKGQNRQNVSELLIKNY